MKHKIIDYTQAFLLLVLKLGFISLIVFGLKTCVFDHNLELDAAMAWCEVKHKEYSKNQDKFISYYKKENQRGNYIFLENSPEERKASLPTEFSISQQGEATCEIVYCLKIGLSRCRYDHLNKTVILVDD